MLRGLTININAFKNLFPFSDLKRYGSVEVDRLKRQVTSFKKGGGGMDRGGGMGR